MKRYYEQLMESLSPGLERAILRVLTYHVGRENRIGRRELVLKVHELGFSQGDRCIRETIALLRKQKFMICSQVDGGGGYWLAKDRDEYAAFRAVELAAKRDDLNNTLRAMDAGADEAWTEVIQGRLF